jgi:hypothetical protein
MDRYRLMLGLVVCVMLYTAVQVYAQPQYMVTDLGALRPTAVINGPIVFGNLNGEPVRWQNGQVRVLQHYGHGGQVNGANARGDSVGFVWLPGSDGRLRRVAAFWSPDGAVVLLPGSGETEARGLNMNRVIAGVSLTLNRGLRWVPGRNEEVLQGFSGHSTLGHAVDELGRAWGQMTNVAVMWDVDGTLHDFIPVGGVQAIARVANATVGAGLAAQGSAIHAAHFRVPLSITRLPNPPEGVWNCGAFALSPALVTVGGCTRRGAPPNVSLAMLWPNATTAIELSTVTMGSPALERATGISDDGHIVGHTDGRGWLLAPGGPQPPALALRLNQDAFRPGETLAAAVEVDGGPADLHVAVILPDGVTTLFLTNLDTLSRAGAVPGDRGARAHARMGRPGARWRVSSGRGAVDAGEPGRWQDRRGGYRRP